VHELLPDVNDLPGHADPATHLKDQVLTAYAHLKDQVLRAPRERGGTNDDEGGSPEIEAQEAQEAQHAHLRKRFVKTYEEKVSWLHLFGTYHHV
jgi:hypothetical protein